MKRHNGIAALLTAGASAVLLAGLAGTARAQAPLSAAEAGRHIVIRGEAAGVIAGTPAPAASLEAVNAVLRENPTYAQIGSGGAGFREWVAVRHPDDRWLVAVAQDAIDLLCRGDLSLLRQCACPTCVRVFYDTTKNHRRRWCVEKCGSRSKAAAYYRRKAAKTGPAGDAP